MCPKISQNSSQKSAKRVFSKFSCQSVYKMLLQEDIGLWPGQLDVFSLALVVVYHNNLIPYLFRCRSRKITEKYP